MWRVACPLVLKSLLQPGCKQGNLPRWLRVYDLLRSFLLTFFPVEVVPSCSEEEAARSDALELS